MNISIIKQTKKQNNYSNINNKNWEKTVLSKKRKTKNSFRRFKYRSRNYQIKKISNNRRQSY